MRSSGARFGAAVEVFVDGRKFIRKVGVDFGCSTSAKPMSIPCFPTKLIRRHHPFVAVKTSSSLRAVEGMNMTVWHAVLGVHSRGQLRLSTQRRGMCVSRAQESMEQTSGEASPSRKVCDRDPSASLQEILGIPDTEAAKLRKDDGTMSMLSGPSWQRLVEAGGGRQSLAWFLVDNLGADRRKVKSAALRNPTALLGRSTIAAGEVSRYLQNLGMEQAAVARVLLRFPQCAHLNVDTLKPKVQWLRENICKDNRGVVRIISLTPQLLGRSVEEALEPQLLWLQVRFQLSSARAASLLRTVPVLFTCCPEKNFEPVTQWLKERIGLNDDDIAAMITAAPTILTMNPTTGIEPKLRWLRDCAGLSEDEIRRLVRACPPILKRSISRSLEPKFTWLRETLGLSPTDVKLLVLRCPNVTGASLDGNLRLKLPWLTNTVGLSCEEAVQLMSRNPVVMLLSIENNLEPTLEFYREQMGASPQELRTAMMQNPRLLATSLEGRLVPRAAAMRAQGIKPSFNEHHSHVGVLSDAKFDAYVAHRRSVRH